MGVFDSRTKTYLIVNIVTIAHMAPELMEKRIPVSETRWKQLGQLKQAGQTYDALLGEMAQAYHRQQLAQRARRAREGQGVWHTLKEV